MAHKLHVTGWVRNLFDGRLEALAQGHQSALQEFLFELHRGPQRSEVKDIQVTLVEEHEDMKEFKIIENSEVPWSKNS